MNTDEKWIVRLYLTDDIPGWVGSGWHTIEVKPFTKRAKNVLIKRVNKDTQWKHVKRHVLEAICNHKCHKAVKEILGL